MMFVVVLFLLCMGSFVSCDPTLELKEDANSSCIEKERQALLSIKANLVDIHNNLYDWGSQQQQRDCCKWVGVFCNASTGHVISLHLFFPHVGLSGKISSYLPLLHQLEYLYLSGIDFQFDPIPTSLGSLTNLRYLVLSSANLSGSIPHQLANLSNLRHLDLSDNFLEGSIPHQLANLSNLLHLDLSNNSLEGPIPFPFNDLTSLTYLDLSENFLNGSLPNLPKDVGQLSNLEYLNVSSNSLEGVISDVHFLNLINLTYLDLSFNSLAFEFSSIPSQLKTIKLQYCKLGPSFPAWLQTQRQFTHLDISSAGISDTVPAWFWELPFGLTFLDLSSNELKGMLPNMMSNIRGYLRMDLSYNQLEGRIPLLPSNLLALSLSGNNFSGNLSFLCQIHEELTLLDLSNNLLSGRLPDCWFKFQRSLVVLNLSNNTLSGEIPSSLGFLSQLEALYLRSNAFVGEVPISLSNCTKLMFADFGENDLSGSIPTWIGERLSNLSFLVLRSNSFYGRLPSHLCWLNNLQVLDLSKNRFSGNIPRCFGNFTAMAKRTSGDGITNHDCSFTRGRSFRGRYCTSRLIIHDSLRRSPIVQESFEKGVFIDNALVAWKGTERNFGRVDLQLLKSIDLSDNKLSGKLPYEITNLRGLVSLNLSINKLHGEVPKPMGRLKSLDSLDLSGNEFSGNIPSSLSEITSLSYLNLSNNNFSGRIPTGPQLQLFDCSTYRGNRHLYGPPLTPGGCGLPPATVVVGKEDEEEEEDGGQFWESYYIGMGLGFGVGFWGICATIFLNRSYRHFLFASLTHIKDWIYVTVAVHYIKLQRKFKREVAYSGGP